MQQNFLTRLLLTLTLLVGFSPSVWADDIPFRQQRREMFSVCPTDESTVVFLGNSITNFGVWPEVFANNGYRVVNRGISGNFSPEVMQHIRLIADGQPKAIYLMIGINDYGTPDVIVPSIKKTIQIVREVSPSTDIYVQSILPCAYNPRQTTPTTQNPLIRTMIETDFAGDSKVHYADIFDALSNDGSTPKAGVLDDNLHPNVIGYRDWTNKLKNDGYIDVTPKYESGDYTNAGGIHYYDNRMLGQYNKLPLATTDILMMGDQTVQGGEWAELMRNSNVKNRGIGIGTGTLTTYVAKFKTEIPYILHGDVMPGKISVQVGQGDLILNGTEAATVWSTYKQCIDLIHEKAPNAQIYLNTVIPVVAGDGKAVNNAKVVAFNEMIRNYATSTSYCTLVDIAQRVSGSDGYLAAEFEGANSKQSKVPNARAYLEWANLLTSTMGLTTQALPTMTANQYALVQKIDDSYAKAYALTVGDKLGNVTQNSLSTLLTAAATAKGYTTSTDDSAIEAQISALTSAVNSMNSDVVLTPQLTDAQGHPQYYTFKSLRNNRYVTAQAGNSSVQGITAKENGSYWRFVRRTQDSNYDLVNFSTGEYISADGVNSGQVMKLVNASPNKGWRIEKSRKNGYFYILGDDIQFNQANNNNNVLTWVDQNVNGDDGCCYTIEAIEYDNLPEIVEEEVLTYQLTDVAGTVHTFTARGTAGQTAPTISGAAGATLTNPSWSGSTYKATVTFPFAVSKQGGTSNYVGISAFNGTAFYYYAKDGGVRVTKNATPNDYTYAWCIYPSIDENGKFTFTVKNVETETYIYSTSTDNNHNTGAVTLAAQGTPMTYVNSGFLLPTDKYLSVNSSGTATEQNVGTWASHGGTSLKFTVLDLEEKQPEQPETPVEGAVSYTLNLNHENLGHLMPQPRSVNLTGSTANLSGNINVVYNVQPTADSPLPAVMTRFLSETGCTAGEGTNLHVNFVEAITGTEDYTVADFDNESYALKIDGNDITISAIKPIGVIRAVQTLTMMAKENSNSLPGCEIVDWPAFKVRGLMHDIGRSYISVEELKKEIDLLARFKENVFLWHLTDKHGFRFESKTHKNVNTNFSPTRSDKFYTQEECHAVSEYAYERGITIIPEIDMPGHSARFQGATGVTMASPEGRAILKDVLKELVNTFDRSPYIHIGGDETAEATRDYINEMGAYVRSLGRKVVIWNCYGRPAVSVTPSNMEVDMTTNWATAGRLSPGIPNIDMRYNYLNHFDMYGDLAGIYRSSIFGVQKGNPDVAGSISGIWNDRLIPEENLIVRENNLYAYAIATADRAWKGGGRHYIDDAEGGAYLPNSGEDYEEFKDWETRFLYHKNTTLAAVKSDIPYVKQTNVRWNITPAFDNGGDRTKKFDFEDAQELTVLPGSTFATGAGIWLNHIWANTVAGVLGKAAQPTGKTRYAWTYVYSPTERTVGAQVETYNYSRSQMGAAPAHGTWDNRGSRIWVNDTELKPNAEKWTTAGADEEDNLGNINFTTRDPLQVHLNEGWNKVLLKLPNTGANLNHYGGKWQYTFVFTDPTGTDAVEDLIYSPTKKMDGNEDFNVPPVPRVEPTVSTADETHWYTIQSARGSYNVKSAGLGANMTREAALSEAAYWKFERRSDNSYNIINYSDGGYLSPAPVDGKLQCVKAEPANGWTLDDAAADGYFIVKCDANHTQLHNDKNGNVLNWGYGSSVAGQYRADDDGCEFIFTEIEGLAAPNTPDAPASQRYTIRLVDTDFYFTTNEVNDNSNKTYSISTDPEIFVVNKVDGGYTIVSENGKQVGVNSNGWDFANSAYTWNIENIEEPTRILMNGQQKGFGVNDKANNAPAFTDKHAGNANNDATRYTWLFEAVDVPGEVYYTITNHQYDGKTHAFYVQGNQLNIGGANIPATEFGEEALFVKEDMGNNKWAFKNKASGEYLVFRGNGAGTNSDKGVLSTYNSAYCDFTLTPNSRVENGFIITGKRNNNTDGTYVVKTGGAFDAWSAATECWNGTYSNIFAIEEVIVGGSEPDVLFTTDTEATANEYRWVRITNARDAYSVYASTDAKLHSQPTDFTNEGELFALVGTEDNFKLYSRTAKAYFGYSATGGGSEVTKGATTQTFKLIDNTTNSVKGLNIVPTGNESQSFNMHGGKGNDIKFYGVGDGGSTWKITLVNKEEKGGIRLVGTPTSALNKLIGKLSVSVGAASGETLLTTENIAGRDNVTYYVNAKNHLAITPGYTFRGYKAPTVDGMNVTYTVDEDNKAQYLFYSTGAAHPYRIPSITRTKSGRLIAFSDYRFGGGDIGAGRVDIVARTSDDNGATWSDERTILQGDGNSQSRTCGFGDAASVADWESDDVMLMSCSAPNGGTCWTAAQRGIVAVSHNGGDTWETPVDIKDQICNATGSLLDGTNIVNYFVGSGKLHQSRYIKVGSHYRVYAPLFTTPGSGYNNYVVYTDDFGKTWKLLGDKGTPCVVNGNEPKCEELPDGSVIISSRVNNSRYYNVFTYNKNDKNYATGSWGQRVNGCNSGDSGTDGEILITKAVRKSDGQLVTIALQSMPNSGRNNVTIWYKELSSDPAHQFTSSEFAGAWTVGKQVSNTSSAYSTMCMQNDGHIAFFFEEGPAGYEMVYMPLTISEATGGAYGPDFWTIGHAAKAVKMTEDGNCTLREILDIERYLLNPAK